MIFHSQVCCNTEIVCKCVHCIIYIHVRILLLVCVCVCVLRIAYCQLQPVYLKPTHSHHTHAQLPAPLSPFHIYPRTCTCICTHKKISTLFSHLLLFPFLLPAQPMPSLFLLVAVHIIYTSTCTFTYTHVHEHNIMCVQVACSSLVECLWTFTCLLHTV